MDLIEYTNHEIEDISDTVCGVCHAEFLDPEDLNLHIIQYHVSETNKNRFCKFCSRIFSDVDAFALHIRNDHVGSLKSCKYCKRLFLNENYVLQHEKKHKSKQLFPKIKCSVCDSIFIDKKLLEAHEFEEHDSEDGVMLQHCYAALSVVLHMNARSFFEVSHKNLSYKCQSCNYLTPNLDIYLDHVKTSKCHTVCCDKCFDVFRLKSGLYNHFIKHELQAKRQSLGDVKCTKCNQYFPSVEDLVNHTSTHSVSSTMPVQMCQFCRRPIVGQTALLKHIERTHKFDCHLYKYNCIYCNIKFKHPKMLFGHFFSQHKDILPYTCIICDKKFRIRKKFTLHIKLEHKSIGFVDFDDNFHVSFTNKEPVKKSVLESNDSTFSKDMLTSLKDENEESNQSVTTIPLSNDVDLFKIKLEIEQEKVNSYVDINKSDSDNNLLVERAMPKKQNRNVKTKKRRQRKPSGSDSDVPLAKIMKKGKKKLRGKKNKKFVCPKCNQKCYTYHFFNQHMALHNKSEKCCIKCNEKFQSVVKLREHVASKHFSSQLTDTLKKVLEKRKETFHQIHISKQFLNTMKKVPVENTGTPAKITLVNDKLSAKNFLENFTPEVNDVKIGDVINVTIKSAQDKPRQLIKMTKFTPEQPCTNPKNLKMPEKFQSEPYPEYKVSIKLISQEQDINPSFNFNEMNLEDSHADADDYEEIQERAIPEVGNEIMLEESKPEDFKHCKKTIVIKNIDQHEIRIAHLAPEAPYFKIVSMGKVITPKEEEPPKDVTLPNGTKLVSVNPLAHLLDKNSIREICKSLHRSKPNPKMPTKDFSEAIVKAMSALEKPVKRVKKVKVNKC